MDCVTLHRFAKISKRCAPPVTDEIIYLRGGFVFFGGLKKKAKYQLLLAGSLRIKKQFADLGRSKLVGFLARLKSQARTIGTSKPQLIFLPGILHVTQRVSHRSNDVLPARAPDSGRRARHSSSDISWSRGGPQRRGQLSRFLGCPSNRTVEVDGSMVSISMGYWKKPTYKGGLYWDPNGPHWSVKTSQIHQMTAVRPPQGFWEGHIEEKTNQYDAGSIISRIIRPKNLRN